MPNGGLVDVRIGGCADVRMCGLVDVRIGGCADVRMCGLADWWIGESALKTGLFSKVCQFFIY